MLITSAIVAAAALASVFFISFVPAVAEGGAFRFVYPWVPELEVNLSFYLDGLSLLFALLISITGGLVALYASAYLADHAHHGRLQAYLLLFMVAMLGLVLADNLITLFVFWELTTIASFLLVGFQHDSEDARRSAVQALLVTAAGGLALLGGLILLGLIGGSFELSGLREQSETVQGHGLYGTILALILVGAFAKSAQVPFHFWLPNAMAAPTPISAYLHSATMVKAGIYLLARLHPVLGGTDAWLMSLTAVGAATALLGSVLALRQTDLKLMLAYSTVMALGTLTMFLGAAAEVAITAAMTFLIVHALYKSALFLVVGVIDHETGTRELGRLGRLGRAMPMTAFAAFVAALSMAGFPPFLGFIGKELRYEGAMAIAGGPVLFVAAAVAANAMMVAVAGLVTLRVFFGPRYSGPKRPHEAPLRMWLGPVVLASLGLAFGVWPGLTEEAIVQPAVAAVLREPVSVDLALWHGINVPLVLSIVTVLIGALIYHWHASLCAALAKLEARLPLSGEQAYERAVSGMLRLGGGVAGTLQSGSLNRYLSTVLVIFVVAVGATLVLDDGFVAPTAWPVLAVYEWAVVALVAAAALTAVLSNSRLTAICALGIVGVGTALLFLMYGAPDLAMTQLLVETLFVAILAVVLLRLPALPAAAQHHAGGWRHAGIAIAAGGLTTALVLGAIASPFDPYVTEFYETRSPAEAHGRNVVNVILVDFRALDTFGEIAVVVAAALAGFGLIGPRLETAARPGRSLILRTASRLLVSLILMFSVFLLIRGHDEPGGGFLGGLIAAIAFVLHILADGPGAVRHTLRISPRHIALAGLAIALLAGLPAALAGLPFLTGLWTTLGAAGPGEHGIPLGTPLLFDVGVYLAVIGSVLTVVLALEET